MSALPAPPPVDHRQRRHSTKTMKLARDLYANGWTPTQIVRHLAEQEIAVSLNTVRLWVVPGAADEHRARNRESALCRIRMERPVLPIMLRWRAAGLSFNSISKLLAAEYGIGLREEQVRYYVKQQREPRQSAKRKVVKP